MPTIIVLNYHRITTVSQEVINPVFLPFTTDLATFTRHLETISQLQIPVIDLAMLPDVMPEAPLSIGITFDDGHASDLAFAAPQLIDHRFPATFFPVVKHLDQPGYLSRKNLLTLQQSGFSIGSHSFSHPLLTRISRAQMEHEIVQSKHQLETVLNIPVEQFAIPYGRYDETIAQTIRNAGYRLAWSTEFGFNHTAQSTFILKRWNVKRSVTEHDLGRVLRNHAFTVAQLQVRSTIRRQVERISDRFHST